MEKLFLEKFPPSNKHPHPDAAIGSGERAIKTSQDALEMWRQKLKACVEKGDEVGVKKCNESIEQIKKDQSLI